MRRREFTALLAGAAAAWPIATRAQRAAAPVIGYLSASSPGEVTRLAAFDLGLKEAGFVVGRDVTIEYRYAEGQYARLPAIVKELIDRKVAVIFASALPAALAAKAMVTTTPVVFASGADPVQLGLVQSLNRPGGNITGVSNHFGALGGKRLELLRELVPKTGLIGYLLNSNNQNAQAHSTEVMTAAQAMKQPIEVLIARNRGEIEAAFDALAKLRAVALLVGDDPFYNTQRTLLVTLAARHVMPTIYYARGFVPAGGLVSYGSSQSETYRQSGLYVGRVLKGEKPADLPVVLPAKFELVINLKTAKALGLTVPPSLLARADEVIE
jgi:putative ABC transport system substrate-binding protein